MFTNQNDQLKKLFNIQKNIYKPQISHQVGILYQKGTKNSIPLKSISYDIEIIESLAFINLTQNYFNSSPNNIETEFFFSISDNACFYQFQAEIDGQIMVGQVKEREEARAEYEQNKAKGNIVAYSETNKEVQDVMKINIGNVPPNKPIQISFGYLQELDICLNKFWKLLIPATLTPRYQSNPNQNLLNIDNFNPNFYQEKSGYEWTIKVLINSMTELSFIRSPSHEINAYSLDNLNTKFQIQFKNKEIPNKDFTLLFRNKSLNQTKISLAHSNEEENPYCAMINFMPDFNPCSDEDAYLAFQKNSAKSNYEVNLMNAKGEFIFLLDRSGSMEGKRIEMAREALKLFVRSLPPDSYFNVIGFGSSIDSLYNASSKTNEKLVESCLASISSIQADLGGTDIYNPLRTALTTSKIDQYPKNIFILTDGDVSNVVKILSLISEYNDVGRVYTIGVGNGCSREIIIEGAKLGKGQHQFIAENENMNEKIIGLLEDSITPFLSDLNLNYDKSLINIIVPTPESINFIRKNEELKIFVFLNKSFNQKKQTNLTLKYYDSTLKKEISKDIQIQLHDSLIQNDYLHKYGAFQMIQRIQRNLTYERNLESDIYMAKKDNLKTYCLNFALKYQILTPFTSFICVIKADKSNLFRQTDKVVIPVMESADYQNLEEKKDMVQMLGLGCLPPGSLNSFSNQFFAQALDQSFAQPPAQPQSFFTKTAHPTIAMRSAMPSRDIQDLECEEIKERCMVEKSNKKTIPGVFDQKSLEKDELEKAVPQKVENSNPWLTLLEKQKFEGFWEMNEMNANLLCKDLQKIKASMPDPYNLNYKNDGSSLWMTCLVLFFLETFKKEKIGSWRLIWKKGEQWMQSKGFNYQLLKTSAKQFFYGASAKNINQIPLIKQCKCGKELIFVKSIATYNGAYFQCDQCSANNFIEGGVFHCESCQYDLCEECNNDQPIICNSCGKGGLKWMTQIPQAEYDKYYWCDVCNEKSDIQNGVYHCSGCGKFDLCSVCKLNR